MSQEITGNLFLQFSTAKLKQLSSRIAICLERLDDRQVWTRGGEHENAVGNLVLHLCGNVRQWIVSGVGGQPGERRRDTEFAARGETGKQELIQRLGATVEDAVSVIEHLPLHRLGDRFVIQGFDVSVLEAVYHVVEHFAMHAGQIMLLTKRMTATGLDFYRDLETAAPRGPQVP